MKIPIEQRPDCKVLINNLNTTVSQSLQQLFVIDIQNDCNCLVENYISDFNDFFILDRNKINHLLMIEEINVPIQTSINDEEIIKLIQNAAEGSIANIDLIPRFLIYNHGSNLNAILSLKDKYSIHANCYFSLSQVPKDEIWLLPDPEFFGVITVNLMGYGVFCINNAIKKIKIYV